MRLCDQCEGTGRIEPEAFSDQTFKCPAADCQNGYVELTFADLDDKRVRYRYVTGYVFMWHGVLTLECADGLLVTNLQPHMLEILS